MCRLVARPIWVIRRWEVDGYERKGWGARPAGYTQTEHPYRALSRAGEKFIVHGRIERKQANASSLAWIPWSALWLGGTQRVQCTRKRHRRLESVASPDVRLAAIISTSSARVLHSALVSQLLSVRPRRDATVGCTAQLRSPRRAPSGTGHLRFLPGEDAKVPQAGFLSIEA